MLCRKLPFGVLWLSLDTQIIMALPSVRGIASHSAGLPPEGLQPPLCSLLRGHAGPPLLQALAAGNYHDG